MSIKAFELVPAIDRLKLVSEKSKSEIICVECCGKNLYIGTSDCFVLHYVIEEVATPGGRISFTSEKQGHKYLAVKKPVMQLKAASALNRVLVLCDHALTLLSMFDLEVVLGGSKIKNVVCFCLNENPTKSNPFSVEICVGLKKKQIQLYTVTEDKMILTKEVNVPEPALHMSMDSMTVCAALQSQYTLVNTDTTHVQELFPYEASQTQPFTIRITKGEFLVNAPSALGMFAMSGGISQRPPLQWSDSVISIVYKHPYILALNDEFITVHSILDQQQKQSIPFQGGQWLGEYEGRIYITTTQDIYSLVCIPVEKQIQSLLSDRRVNEALELATNSNRTGMSKEKFNAMYSNIQIQAGFIQFAQCNFDEARELFHAGDLDIRELISLYPFMLPSNNCFSRREPPLHEIADINQLAKGVKVKVYEFKAFLMAYLEEIRAGVKSSQYPHSEELYTTLLKLYAEFQPDFLLPLITGDYVFDNSDCASTLNKHGRHHALATLYERNGDCEKSLNIWTRICDGELTDDTFPGVQFVAEYLSKLSDVELIWKYADWLLQKDQIAGVKIFTCRPTDSSDGVTPDVIVDYLHNYPKAVVAYLKYLVFEQKLQIEKYHTHLAVLYLDNVLQLKEHNKHDTDTLQEARSELRDLLESSNLYRVQLLLGKIKDTDLYEECAILYGKLEEYDKALSILVLKLRDFVAAERFCIVNSKHKEPAYRKRLFHRLLNIYLDSTNPRSDQLVAPAITLLKQNQSEFDILKVLQVIPDSWSIGLLHQFITSSVRSSLSEARCVHIQRMLARAQNIDVKRATIDMEQQQVNMDENTTCAVCSKPFDDVQFVRYPNGVITHIQCAKNHHICPVSGKLFSTATSQEQPPPKLSPGDGKHDRLTSRIRASSPRQAHPPNT